MTTIEAVEDMNLKCDLCGHNNQDVSKPYRVSMAVCEGCGCCICVDCLWMMALEYNKVTGAENNPDAAELLYHCEATGLNMCAKCFEAD
jgi:hypothetical protein